MKELLEWLSSHILYGVEKASEIQPFVVLHMMKGW